MAADDLLGAQAFHCIVVKSLNFRGTNFFSRGCTGEGLIVKSDDYAVAGNVVIANSQNTSLDDATAEAGAGVLLNAVAAGVDNVSLTNVHSRLKSIGLQYLNAGSPISDTTISNFEMESNTGSGIDLGAGNPRIRISNGVINNSPTGIYSGDTTSDQYSVQVHSVGIANAVFAMNFNGSVAADDMSFQNISLACFNYLAGGTRYLIGQYRLGDNSPIWSITGLTLAGGWANFGAGNSAFSVLPWAGTIRLSGLLTIGSGSTIVTGFSVQIAPIQALRFTALGYNAAVLLFPSR